MDRVRTPTGVPSAADDLPPEGRQVLDELCALLLREARRFRRSGDASALARLDRLSEAVRGHLLALRVLHESASTERSVGPAGATAGRAAAATLPPEDIPAATPVDGAAEDGAGSDRAWRRAVADGDAPPRFPAFRDQETGLHSREGFDTVASGELKRCRRHGRLFSLLMLQLPARREEPAQASEPARREEPVRRGALAVRRNLRESDLVGRHVERTLAIALPETSVEQARLVSRRLVEALETAGAWDADGRLGIAAHPVDGETLWSLLDTARGQLALPAATVLDPRQPEA